MMVCLGWAECVCLFADMFKDLVSCGMLAIKKLEIAWLDMCLVRYCLALLTLQVWGLLTSVDCYVVNHAQVVGLDFVGYVFDWR